MGLTPAFQISVIISMLSDSFNTVYLTTRNKTKDILSTIENSLFHRNWLFFPLKFKFVTSQTYISWKLLKTHLETPLRHSWRWNGGLTSVLDWTESSLPWCTKVEAPPSNHGPLSERWVKLLGAWALGRWEALSTGATLAPCQGAPHWQVACHVPHVESQAPDEEIFSPHKQEDHFGNLVVVVFIPDYIGMWWLQSQIASICTKGWHLGRHVIMWKVNILFS